MSAHVDLVLPGLFNLPLNEFDPVFLKSKLPALNQLLSRSNTVPNNLVEFETIIADCIGLTGMQTLPFAQAYVEVSDDSDRHLLCRAIHLKADMHSALVIPLEDNKTNEDDASLILEDLQTLFSDDCDVKPLKNGLWLMRLKQCDPADGYPHYLSVIGRKANQFIEQSKQALPWYKLMNEMQMFMHQHSINQDRLSTGLLPINSLWFWGAGLHPPHNSNDVHWYCDDEQLNQYADSVKISHEPIHQLAMMQGKEHSLVIDLSLLEALKISSGENLQSKLTELEETLFKPLMTMVKSNQITIQLRAGHSLDITMTPLSKFKFWRQPKNLISFSQQEINT
jgi:hypothetical protein